MNSFNFFLENKVLRFINYVVLFYFLMTLIWSRSFVGIYISNFRIGELFIAGTLVLFLILIITKSQQFNFTLLSINFKILILIIFSHFLFIGILTKASFVSPYTFKASTYIWTVSFLFFGAFSKKVTFNRNQIIIIELAFISIFFTSIYGLPTTIIELIVNISDKYEPHKGSDLGLFFIVVNLLISKSFKYNKISFIILTLNLALFLPLVLYRSRGAFIGVVLFAIYEIYQYFKKKQILKLSNLPIFLLFILISTYSTIVSQVKDFPEEISAEIFSESYSSLGTYRLQNYQEEYPILYVENNRIYSGDGNLNWRLWMWQDQIDYMRENNLIVRGSGYSQKIHVFAIDNTGYGNDRTGLDNINENLHNYFIQILSRGGIIHLILFMYFFSKLVKSYLSNNKNYDILFYLVPLLWISFFDSSMENAHFPLIFYYFLGNIYFKEN